MKYNIENIDEKDIDRIYEIESKTFTSNWKKESFVNQLKRESSLLRVIKNENNEIIGYYWVWNIVNEVQVITVTVTEKFRGKGYGKVLVEDIIRISSENNMLNIYLEVRISNLTAINLYKKFGFTEYRQIENYYNKPVENGICMVKNLGEDNGENIDARD